MAGLGHGGVFAHIRMVLALGPGAPYFLKLFRAFTAHICQLVWREGGVN